MSAAYDDEIAAIGAILKSLEPLAPAARQSALDYVIRRLAIQMPTSSDFGDKDKGKRPEEPKSDEKLPIQPVHIEDLVKTKQPRSAIEMATLVAYYLSHQAPSADRKQTINTQDINTYFKIADFKLPTKPQFTLPNTKNAGYLDFVGNGEYKLNPVGYNLIVHNLPKSKKTSRPNRGSRKKTASRQSRTNNGSRKKAARKSARKTK